MFTPHEAYVAEKTQAQTIEHMQRIAREPSLIERGGGALWAIARATLRGLAHVLVAAGSSLLRLTQTRPPHPSPLDAQHALSTLGRD